MLVPLPTCRKSTFRNDDLEVELRAGAQGAGAGDEIRFGFGGEGRQARGDGDDQKKFLKVCSFVETRLARRMDEVQAKNATWTFMTWFSRRPRSGLGVRTLVINHGRDCWLSRGCHMSPS
jgi:hypothetical protein